MGSNQAVNHMDAVSTSHPQRLLLKVQVGCICKLSAALLHIPAQNIQVEQQRKHEHHVKQSTKRQCSLKCTTAGLLPQTHRCDADFLSARLLFFNMQNSGCICHHLTMLTNVLYFGILSVKTRKKTSWET